MVHEHPPQSTSDEEEHALNAAYRLLGYRARSEAEMRDRLQRKGFAAPVVARTLAKLRELDLLDDREFARQWVAVRTGRGPLRLKQELRQKGIDRDLAELVIQEGLTPEDEFAAAWTVAWRAVRMQALPLDRQELLRVRRLLQRRGFAGDVIGRVCARLNDRLSAEGEWLD